MIWPGPPPAALALVSPLWLPRRSGRSVGRRYEWLGFDPRAEGVNRVSKHPAPLRVVVIEIGPSSLDQGAVFDPHPAAGQISELSGVALASDQHLKHVANRDGV